MVLRVDRNLGGQLDVIADRLFRETAYDHSRAAVVRGLVAIGLAAAARNDVLAPLFVGVRIARGRKRGDPFSRP
jgi:hypothetical protein